MLAICAASAYLNQRFLKWPQVLAMNLMGVGVAIGLIGLGHYGLVPIDEIEAFIRSFDFAGLVLHGILGLLLFAGAMFVDVENLKRWWRAIAALATLGVAMATLVAGTLLWSVAHLTGFDLGGSVKTQVLGLPAFQPASISDRDFYRRNPADGFCRSIIEPKLEKLLRHFPALVDSAAI